MRQQPLKGGGGGERSCKGDRLRFRTTFRSVPGRSEDINQEKCVDTLLALQKRPWARVETSSFRNGCIYCTYASSHEVNLHAVQYVLEVLKVTQKNQ